MKKILFVSHTLDFAAGGAERVLLEILERIDRSRFEIGIAVGRDTRGVPPEFEALGFPIRLLPRLPMNTSRSPWGFLRVGYALLFSSLTLFGVLRRDHYDLIHVNSVFALHFAMLPCLLTRTPLIYHEHGLPQTWGKTIWLIAYPRLIRRVRHTLAITDAVRAQVIGQGAAPDAVTTVHNGIDSEAPSGAHGAHGARPSRAGFSIIQIANLHSWKGQDVVLQSLALLRKELPDASVVFYGRSMVPEFEAQLREMVSTLELAECVEFAGYREDLAALLPTFDCLVVASRAEPFGLVLLEAMRAGVPIVASNAGGVPEIVSDGVNGLLFESEDAQGLADALLRIARDPQLADRLVAEGHRVVESDFSFARQVESIETIFLAQSRAAEGS
ncbi:MAG: glycosyltransferase family 4 protein [Deltaproteobacteria bacterium]|nr:glycosyltransferase family 4 protein [Deltaproteobacteria bacterium]MBW2388527.1 glycosyltransferase family 4 protein [Deltaproteobacteria bacterium]